MSDFHKLRVEAKTREEIEAVSPQLKREKLFWARQKSWEVFSVIKDKIEIGMSEPEAFRMAMAVFKDHGVDRHWHKPYIRFGPGTQRSFHDGLQKDYRLQQDDMVYLDLGPVWSDPETSLDYEGDVGDSFVFGEHPVREACAQAARDVFKSLRDRWKAGSLTGTDLFEAAKQECRQRGYELNESVQGHRISDFPHQKYSKVNLGDFAFQPQADLWILEIHLLKKSEAIGAFYEDLLSMDLAS